MRTKDISSEWSLANSISSGEIGDNPNDHIDWKEIRSHGYDYVSINGSIYQYCKHGLLDKVAQ